VVRNLHVRTACETCTDFVHQRKVIPDRLLLKHALKLRPSAQNPTAAHHPTLVSSITGLVSSLHRRSRALKCFARALFWFHRNNQLRLRKQAVHMILPTRRRYSVVPSDSPCCRSKRRLALYLVPVQREHHGVVRNRITQNEIWVRRCIPESR
jgi:hypothetical protein